MSIKTYSRRDRSDEQVMIDERADEECGEEAIEWISAGEVTDPKINPIKSYACDRDGCSVVLKTLQTLQTHIKKDHLGFKCDVQGCAYVTVSLASLRKHSAKHSSEQPFVCSVDGCGTRFKKPWGLREHMKFIHSGTAEEVMCDWPGCHYKTIYPRTMKKHFLRHQGMKRCASKPGKTGTRLEPINQTSFKCDWPGCLYVTTDRGCLARHRQTHVDYKDRKFGCDWPECDKRFTSATNLTDHLRKHRNEKRYGCQWPGCEFRSVLSGNVNKHMKTHTRHLSEAEAQSMKNIMNNNRAMKSKSNPIGTTVPEEVHYKTSEVMANDNITENQEICDENSHNSMIETNGNEAKERVAKDVDMFYMSDVLMAEQEVKYEPIDNDISDWEESNDSNDSNEDFDRRSDNQKPFACDWIGCGKRFKNKDYIRRHQRRVHQKNEELNTIFNNNTKSKVEESIGEEVDIDLNEMSVKKEVIDNTSYGQTNDCSQVVNNNCNESIANSKTRLSTDSLTSNEKVTNNETIISNEKNFSLSIIEVKSNKISVNEKTNESFEGLTNDCIVSQIDCESDESQSRGFDDLFHEESETEISDRNEDTIETDGNEGLRSLSDNNRDQEVWQSIDSKEGIIDSEETEECYGNRSNTKRKNLHSEQLKDTPLLVCQQTGCQYSTESPIDYKQHIRCNHKNLFCGFEGCTYRSHSSKLMYSHKRIHKDITQIKHFKCQYPECDRLFRFKSNFKLHLKMHITSIEVKEFRCQWTGCDQTFAIKKQLCGHMKVHKVDKPFQCDWPGCQRTYSTDENMRIHLRTHSKDKDIQTKRFKCHWPGCKWTGAQKQQLDYHMTGHQELMPFECHWPGCERRFRSKHQLTYHMNTHNNVRPFRCKWSDCDKAFNDPMSLRQHYGTHSGHPLNVKTYKCPHCSKTFRQYPPLYYHIKNKHKPKTIE